MNGPKFFANNLSFGDIQTTDYDLILYSCDYQDRCTFIPSQLSSISYSNAYAFISSSYDVQTDVRGNYEFFSHNTDANLVNVDNHNESEVYSTLHSLELTGHNTILVDYSCMPSTWYSGILKWAEVVTGSSGATSQSSGVSDITIDFVYAVGEYKNQFTPKTVGAITPLPGRYASHLSDRDSVAIFGLGYDSVVVESVHDRIEPDRVYAFMASPGASQNAAQKVENENRFFIEDHAYDTPLRLPLRDVSRTAARLRELALPYLGEFYILLIPLGPKPHVLSSLLVCMEYPKNISCLSVQGERNKPVNVVAQGDIVCTRVNVFNESSSTSN